MRVARVAAALALASGLIVSRASLRANPADASSGIDCLCPRAPDAELDSLRRVVNPFVPSAENLARGRALYLGKGFCATCHGRDGRGFGADADLSRLTGALPRDFTGRAWQDARSDGELIWVLEHGVPGTAMAAFVPGVLTRAEAWQVLLYVRAFGHAAEIAGVSEPVPASVGND